MRTPTEKQVRAALDVLERSGRAGFKPEMSVSRGKAIGLGMAHRLAPEEVVDAAIKSLEEWNGHLSVAALEAIEKGRGEVKRTGRKLEITLPEHWAEC